MYGAEEYADFVEEEIRAYGWDVEEDEVEVDPHGVWCPSEFRALLEAALTKALREDRLGRGAAKRRANRRALALSGAQVVVDEAHRLPPPRIAPETADWYSDAPKATGEVQDVVPDEADPELRAAAAWLHRNPEPLGWQEKTEWLSRFEFQFFVSLEDADAVALRTVDEIRSDEDVLAYALRDDSPAPRGYGMTVKEFRRKWYMDARLRYEQMLTQALAFHRAKTAEDKNKIKHHKILKSQADQANAVLAKWRFVDELARHGVFDPDAATIKKLKAELTVGFKPNFANAYMELSWRTKLAGKGQYDRYLNPIA